MSCIILNRRLAPFLVPALGTMLLAPACQKAQRTASEQLAGQQAEQKTFSSPDDAGAALVAAIQSGDQKALIEIFGLGSNDVLFAGDAGMDKDNLQNFAAAYGQMHRWSKMRAGGDVLQVGMDNYPFPIPLGQNASGQWYFDTAAGKDEILARRIGRNELKAMDACAAIARAERRYYAEAHDGENHQQYARQLVSDPGKHNGLYWPAPGGQKPSPLGDLEDFTRQLSAATEPRVPVLFNGYNYRILTWGSTPATRAFGVLAYPADYRQSGIMSFVADNKGDVYQKDLGEHTADIAGSMAEFNPADGWSSTSMRTGMASRTRQ